MRSILALEMLAKLLQLRLDNSEKEGSSWDLAGFLYPLLISSAQEFYRLNGRQHAGLGAIVHLIESEPLRVPGAMWVCEMGGGYRGRMRESEQE